MPIRVEIEYLSKTMRPKFNQYCKFYIDLRKNHASELRNGGFVKHVKENDIKE